MSSATKIYKKIYKNCPECKSNNIVKNGHRESDKGVIQRYKCKNCNFRFQSNRQTSRRSNALLDLYFFKSLIWMI